MCGTNMKAVVKVLVEKRKTDDKVKQKLRSY